MSGRYRDNDNCKNSNSTVKVSLSSFGVIFFFWLVLLTIQEFTGISLAGTIAVVQTILIIMLITIPILLILGFIFVRAIIRS